MTDIFGPNSYGSSPSAVLQSSLESRLRARMDVNGSPEYELTWKLWAIGSGPPICALRASGRRISDRGCTGWVTPAVCDAASARNNTARRNKIPPTGIHPGNTLTDLADLAGLPTAASRDWKGATRQSYRERGGGAKGEALPKIAEMAGWPSPNTPSGGRSMDPEKMDATGKTLDGKKHTASLEHAATFAGWPTPMAGTKATEQYNEAGNTDSRKTLELVGWPTPRTPTGGPESAERKKELGRESSGGGSVLPPADRAGWTTPRSSDGKTGRHYTDKMSGKALPVDATLAGWSTPSSRDWKDTPGMATEGVNPDGSQRKRLDQLPRQATLAGLESPKAKTGKYQYSQGDPDKPILNLEGMADLAGAPSGISALTGASDGYRLNPRFSLWLMGYPAEWASCGERGIASCRRSRRNS